MTEDQHMQKAREIVTALRKTGFTSYEQLEAIIATALSEAYRSGVEEEMAKWRRWLRDAANEIAANEIDAAIQQRMKGES